MRQSKIRKLIIEQTAGQLDSIIKTNLRIEKFIKFTNNQPDDYKNKLKINPTGPDGKIYFSKAKELLTAFISDLKNTPQDFINNNKTVIAETIKKFKKTLLDVNPTVYKSDFSDIIDTIYKSDLDDVVKPPEKTAPAIETNRTESEVKADLDAAIKSGDQEKANKLFDELAAVRKKADPSYEPMDLLKKYPAEGDAAKSPATAIPSTATAATAGTPTKGEYATGYAGVSIVDFLDQSGKPSDFASRKELATKMGIPEYKGTASQNLLMLNALRGGQKEIATQPAQKIQPEDKPMSSVPSIKFGDMKFPPYVDMGGGRYVRATPEQIADPNLQLYIQNPKKGAGEYNKANFVKVRREKGGQEIRRQSQFGGAVGSASNLLGDIGNTLSKPFRK